MDRMMEAMAITPSGDVDVGFAEMMIPHHQGAIEMAQAKLLHGHNVLGLSNHADGSGTLDALSDFMTNPAGAAIVNAIGPIRQIVQGGADQPRRYLVIAPNTAPAPGAPVQIQSP